MIKEKNTNNSKITVTINEQGYKVYNHNNKICNTINIYLRGGCDALSPTKTGHYVSLLYNGYDQIVLKNTYNNTTVNRMLLTGLLESLKNLTQPTLIYLYTHTLIGFSGGPINSDLKTELFKYISDNNHSVVEIISNDYQEYLKSF